MARAPSAFHIPDVILEQLLCPCTQTLWELPHLTGAGAQREAMSSQVWLKNVLCCVGKRPSFASAFLSPTVDPSLAPPLKAKAERGAVAPLEDTLQS